MRRQRHKWINPFTFLSFKYFIFTKEKTVKLLEILSVIGNLLTFADRMLGKDISHWVGAIIKQQKKTKFFPAGSYKIHWFLNANDKLNVYK